MLTTKNSAQLIASVAAGGREGAGDAGALASLDPEAAAQAIEHGLKVAHEDFVRKCLIKALQSDHSPKAVLLLKKLLDAGATPVARYTAARAYSGIDPARSVQVALREWRRIHFASIEMSPFDDVSVLLIESQRPEAADGLQEAMPYLSPVRKVFLMLQIGLTPGMGAFNFDGARQPSAESRDLFYRKIERLLVSELENKQIDFGLSASDKNSNFKDPRVCDVAASTLAVLFPKSYRFRMTANSSPESVESQRLTVLNSWRAHNSMALKPSISFVATDAPNKVVDPLISLVEQGDKSKRVAAENNLMALGLPALHPVQDALNDLSKKDPRRGILEGIASRLSLCIREVRIEHEPAQGGLLLKYISSLRSQRLASTDMKRILDLMSTHWPALSKSIAVSFVRDSTGPGFVCNVDFQAPGSSPDSWMAHDYVRAGSERPKTSSGVGQMINSVMFTAFFKNIDAACRSGANVPITVALVVSKGRPRTGIMQHGWFDG